MGLNISGLISASLLSAKPSVLSADFLSWQDKLVSLRIDRCPIARATSIYCSYSSGNDSNTGLSPDQAVKTLSTALSKAGSSDTAILLKRGDAWPIETVGNGDSAALAISARPSFTVAAYGSGDLPEITAFARSFSYGSFRLAGGTALKVSPGLDGGDEVAAIRIRGDTENLYKRVELGTVTSEEGTWHYNTATDELIVNFKEEHQGDCEVEVAYENDMDGIFVTNSDNVRIDSIRATGFGLGIANPVNQKMGISVSVNGTQEVVVTYCEVFYASTHCFQQYATTGGGIVTFAYCRAGGTTYSAGSGESIYNTYQFATDTTNAETIFYSNETTYGTLPDYRWVTGGETKRGQTCFGHTGDLASPALVLCKGHRTRPHAWGALQPAGIEGYQSSETDIENIKTFIYNERFEMNDGAGIGFANRDWGVVRANGYYGLKPANTSGQAFASFGSSKCRAWWLNLQLDIDLANMSSSNPFCLLNETPNGDTSVLVMQGCHLSVSNFGDSSRYFGLGLDGWTANVSVQTNYNQYVYNSVITRQNETFGLCSGNGNSTARLKNNALWGVYAGAQAGLNWNGDAGEVNLGATVAVGADVATTSALYQAGTGTGTLALAYDYNGRARSTTTPTIGPLEPRPASAAVAGGALNAIIGF